MKINISITVLLVFAMFKSYEQSIYPAKVIVSGHRVIEYIGSPNGDACQISILDLQLQNKVINTIHFVSLIDTFGTPQWDADSNSINLLRLGAFLTKDNIRGSILEYKLDKSGSIIYGNPTDKVWSSRSTFGELYEVVIVDPQPIAQMCADATALVRDPKICLRSRDFFAKKGHSFFILLDDPFTNQTRLWEYYGEKLFYPSIEEEDSSDRYRENQYRWKEIFTIPSKNEDAPVMAYPKGEEIYVITQSKDLYLIGATTQKLGTITQDLSDLTIVVNKDKGSVGYCHTTEMETWLKDTKQPIDVRPLEELMAK